LGLCVVGVQPPLLGVARTHTTLHDNRNVN
jgi:hypothetical protein